MRFDILPNIKLVSKLGLKTLTLNEISYTIALLFYQSTLTDFDINIMCHLGSRTFPLN